MAFQTNTMVNGQWTATTMDASTVLRHLDEQEQLPESVPTAALPVRGLLSQTVIPSPVVHWILPARLRTTELNDVAFIGVSLHSLGCSSHLSRGLRDMHLDGARLQSKEGLHRPRESLS